ncbi:MULTISPECIES: glycosyltransferase family 2 protein [unclassified Exiguobacterium]|uniref:glycosyltransferase family 2 protein n=1 Tax=unclassified Exiguobacterium TaxID=2644629 RepID=UPI001BEA7DEA|nr:MULTISPECIES: glycosyltransferase family 2 protein [unclassified Exiguobacterium]
MRNSLVSIIMPTYNSEEFVKESINSVINQTYNNFELIIIDDSSKDNTVKVVTEMMKNDNRINLITLPNNSGAAVARNKGIDNAKGRYIAFLDSDDLWLEDKLEIQINFMNKYSYPFTYTNYIRINENNELINEIKVPPIMTYKKLLKNTIIGCSTVVVDREIIPIVHMPLIRRGQDTATWLKILKKIPRAHGYNESYLTVYRERRGSISSNKLKALKRTWYLYRKIEQINLMKSIYYFLNYMVNATIKRLKKNK